MTVKELRELRARLITQARAKRDEITATTTEARAAEIETEFEAIIAEANVAERQADNQETLERSEASLLNGNPNAPLGANGESRTDQPGANAMTYRGAFHALMLAGGQRADMTPEARAILMAGEKDLTPEQRAQIAGDAASGGHLVPDEAMAAITASMAAWGPMLDDDFCTILNTPGGGSMPLPGVDDTANEGTATPTEGAALVDDGGNDVVFSKTTLDDFMIDTEWLRVSIQLATSGMENMETLLASLLGERLGRKGNRDLTTGTGSGAPLGVVVGAGVGLTVAGVAAITADEVQKFLHSIDPAYRASPKYFAMFNDTTLLALHQLKDGAGNYLIKEAPDGAGRLRVGAVSVRYKINQAMPDIGANNRSMVAGDFSRYFVRKIGGTVIGTMQGKEFWPGFGVAGYQRFDGAVGDAKALKALVHPAV